MGNDTILKVPVIYGGNDNCLYTCPVGGCSYKGSSMTNIKSHFRHSHSAICVLNTFDFVFKCSKCSLSLCSTNARQIDNHWVECNSTPNTDDGTMCRPTHQCPNCERAFYHSLALKKHQTCHTAAATATTSNTSTMTTSSNTYTIDLTYDGPHQPFRPPCPVCTAAKGKMHPYSNIRKLRIHMDDAHSRSKLNLRVTCGICGFVQTGLENLKAAASHYRGCLHNNIPFTAVADMSLEQSIAQTQTTHVEDLPGSPGGNSDTSAINHTIPIELPQTSHNDENVNEIDNTTLTQQNQISPSSTNTIPDEFFISSHTSPTHSSSNSLNHSSSNSLNHSSPVSLTHPSPNSPSNPSPVSLTHPSPNSSSNPSPSSVIPSPPVPSSPPVTPPPLPLLNFSLSTSPHIPDSSTPIASFNNLFPPSPSSPSSQYGRARECLTSLLDLLEPDLDSSCNTLIDQTLMIEQTNTESPKATQHTINDDNDNSPSHGLRNWLNSVNTYTDNVTNEIEVPDDNTPLNSPHKNTQEVSSPSILFPPTPLCDFSFTPGSLQDARDSLRRFIREHEHPTSSLETFETGFQQWCNCASNDFSKRSNPQGAYNAGAKNRSLRNREEPFGFGRKRTRYRKNVALRKAFKRDQKGTVRKIIGEKNSGLRCPIAAAKLGEEFKETYSLPAEQRVRKPLPEWMGDPSPPSSSPSSSTQRGSPIDRITPMEVESALNSRDLSSAPGTDGLSYSFWKTLDPKGLLLSRLFEICRNRGRIFSSWRKSRITLICKNGKGDHHSIGNWRPIAICHTIYRLYTTVIARRVIRWAKDNNIISPDQKGFMPSEGVFEHLFMLDEVIADSKLGRRSVCVTWLDIRNAFGSVRPDCILQTLEHFGAPNYICTIVKDLYQAGSFSLRGGDGRHVEVPTEKGVRQGCPLSGILFNIVVEVLLRGLHQGEGYNMGQNRDKTLRSLAYADDICLVTQSRQQMQSQLRRCEVFARWAGFEFNNSKCASMCSSPRGGIDTRPYQFCNGEVKALSRDRFYKYLGANTGYRLPCSDAKLLQKTQEDITKLFESPLLASQKVHALKRFIIPTLSFHLRVRPFTQRDLGGLDRHIKRCVRAAFRLPGNTCTSFFHTPCSKGGLGIPALAVECDILTVSHVFKMLSSPDYRVRDVAYDRLKWLTKRSLHQEPTREDCADFLNGQKPGEAVVKQSSNSGTPRDIYSRVKRSSRRLRIGFKPEEGSSCFSLTFCKNLVESKDRLHVTKALHQYQHLVWFDKWANSPSQGKSASSLARYPVSNHWIADPVGFNPAAISFCFKARLSLLPTLNVVRRFSNQNFEFVPCRGCGVAEESLGHVLNACKGSMDLELERHNRVERILYANIPQWKFHKIDRDRVNLIHREMTGEDRRPDIVAYSRDGPTIVLDVTCPYVSSPDSIDAAATRKFKRYEQLCTNIQSYNNATNGQEVLFFPFVIGSLGCYSKYNQPAMDALGIPRRVQTKIKKQMVLEVIDGSKNIWTRFIGNVHDQRRRRQNEDGGGSRTTRSQPPPHIRKYKRRHRNLARMTQPSRTQPALGEPG